MKKRLIQKVVALAIAFSLVLGEGSSVRAAQPDDGTMMSDVGKDMLESSEEAEEELLLEASEETEGNLPLEEEESSVDDRIEEEASTEEVAEDAHGEVPQEETENNEEADEKEIVEETEESSVEVEITPEEEVSTVEVEENEDLENLFPGLEESYTLSSTQMADKKELSSFVEEITNLKEDEDYVADEIMVEAETEELAHAYAKAFGGILKDYVLGIAVITLEDKAGIGEVCVATAVAASAREDILLPAAWPNYYRYIYSAANTKPTDPFLAENNPRYQWYHNVIGSQQAWEAGFTGKGVTVAVLDSGIREGHEDVQATDVNYFSGANVTITSGNDGHGHGTHVAGIIAAKKNDKGGIGIAYDANLIS
ncbi:MAG: S8 family peptidase, partial [Lachnospiraceae bacterium]